MFIAGYLLGGNSKLVNNQFCSLGPSTLLFKKVIKFSHIQSLTHFFSTMETNINVQEIKSNYSQVLEKIEERISHNSFSHKIDLVCVSKMKPKECIEALYEVL